MWEWRAFFPGSLPAPAGFPAAHAPSQERVDVYFAAPGLPVARNLKLREAERLELKVREEEAEGVERWTKPCAHDLPVPPWVAREVAHRLGVARRIPVRPLRDRGGVVDFLQALGLSHVRQVVVRKQLRRRRRGDGVLREHATLELADARWTTLAVEGAALADVRAAIPTLAPALVGGYPAFLAGLSEGLIGS